MSQPGFDPSYGNLVCLATVLSSDRTKQICLWMTIYIYIYVCVCVCVCVCVRVCVYVCVYMCVCVRGLVGRVFANGLGDLDSITGRVIPKTLNMVLDTSLLNTQQYKVRIKVKWSNPGKEVAPSPTPRCSSYWKGSLLVALDSGCQLYLLLIFLIVSCC